MIASSSAINSRSSGTLMCHYRHHAHDDPLLLPGLQNITAHVNFTGIAECGLDAGLELIGYTSQAFFLINCGITALLQDTSPENEITSNLVYAEVEALFFRRRVSVVQADCLAPVFHL